MGMQEAFEQTCREKNAYSALTERDWFELGYKAALSHGSKAEPVKYEYQGVDGYWYGFDSEKHFQNTKDAGFPIRALYTHRA